MSESSDISSQPPENAPEEEVEGEVKEEKKIERTPEQEEFLKSLKKESVGVVVMGETGHGKTNLIKDMFIHNGIGETDIPNFLLITSSAGESETKDTVVYSHGFGKENTPVYIYDTEGCQQAGFQDILRKILVVNRLPAVSPFSIQLGIYVVNLLKFRAEKSIFEGIENLFDLERQEICIVFTHLDEYFKSKAEMEGNIERNRTELLHEVQEDLKKTFFAGLEEFSGSSERYEKLSTKIDILFYSKNDIYDEQFTYYECPFVDPKKTDVVHSLVIKKTMVKVVHEKLDEEDSDDDEDSEEEEEEEEGEEEEKWTIRCTACNKEFPMCKYCDTNEKPIFFEGMWKCLSPKCSRAWKMQLVLQKSDLLDRITSKITNHIETVKKIQECIEDATKDDLILKDILRFVGATSIKLKEFTHSSEDDPSLNMSKKKQAVLRGKVIGGVTGGAVGVVGGATVGATVGTTLGFVAPGVGNVVGFVAGAALGSFYGGLMSGNTGTQLGKLIGQKGLNIISKEDMNNFPFVKKINEFQEELHQITESLDPYVEQKNEEERHSKFKLLAFKRFSSIRKDLEKQMEEIRDIVKESNKLVTKYGQKSMPKKKFREYQEKFDDMIYIVKQISRWVSTELLHLKEVSRKRREEVRLLFHHMNKVFLDEVQLYDFGRPGELISLEKRKTEEEEEEEKKGEDGNVDVEEEVEGEMLEKKKEGKEEKGKNARKRRKEEEKKMKEEEKKKKKKLKEEEKLKKKKDKERRKSERRKSVKSKEEKTEKKKKKEEEDEEDEEEEEGEKEKEEKMEKEVEVEKKKRRRSKGLTRIVSPDNYDKAVAYMARTTGCNDLKWLTKVLAWAKGDIYIGIDYVRKTFKKKSEDDGLKTPTTPSPANNPSPFETRAGSLPPPNSGKAKEAGQDKGGPGHRRVRSGQQPQVQVVRLGVPFVLRYNVGRYLSVENDKLFSGARVCLSSSKQRWIFNKYGKLVCFDKRNMVVGTQAALQGKKLMLQPKSKKLFQTFAILDKSTGVTFLLFHGGKLTAFCLDCKDSNVILGVHRGVVTGQTWKVDYCY